MPNRRSMHRGRRAVELRQHLRILCRRDLAVLVDRHRREVAAARRAKRLEHRMRELERADARGVAARAIDRIAHHAWQQIDVSRPVRPLSCRDEQPAALLDVSREAPRQRRRDDNIVQDDRSTAPQILLRQVVRQAGHHFKPRRFADRQRARQIQARVAGAAIDDRHAHRFGWRDDEVEGVVRGQCIRRQRHRRLRIAVADQDWLEFDLRSTTGLELHRLGPVLDAVDVERQRGAADRLDRVIRQARGDGHALLIREGRARQRHRGDADVHLILGATDRNRRDRCPLRQADAFFTAPSAPLEVADEHDLAARQRGFRKDAARNLQRRRVARRARSWLGRRNRCRQWRVVHRRAHGDVRPR